jgi:hypothetical protein
VSNRLWCGEIEDRRECGRARGVELRQEGQPSPPDSYHKRRHRPIMSRQRSSASLRCEEHFSGGSPRSDFVFSGSRRGQLRVDSVWRGSSRGVPPVDRAMREPDRCALRSRSRKRARRGRGDIRPRSGGRQAQLGQVSARSLSRGMPRGWSTSTVRPPTARPTDPSVPRADVLQRVFAIQLRRSLPSHAATGTLSHQNDPVAGPQDAYDGAHVLERGHVSPPVSYL